MRLVLQSSTIPRAALFASFVACSFLLSWSTAAKADSQVVVLGITSVDGDDEIARNLTGALRNSAGRIPGWRLNDVDVPLSQAILAGGCPEPPTAACLAEIAQSLGATRLVYGTMNRSGGSGDALQFEATIYTFDSVSNAIDGVTTTTFSQQRSDVDDLREPARRAIAGLRGGSRSGTLIVQGAPNGSQILIDDQHLGSVQSETFQADLEPGTHELRILSNGRTVATRSFNLAAQGREVFEVETVSAAPTLTTPTQPVVQPGGDLPWEFWVGVGATTVGVAFAALTAYSWVSLDSARTNPDFIAFRNQFAPPETPGGVRDVCSQVNGTTPQGARDACDTARSQETLQYVFLGVAVLGLAVGIPLIAANSSTAHRDSDAARAVARAPRGPSFTLLPPSIGPTGAFVGARLEY